MDTSIIFLLWGVLSIAAPVLACRAAWRVGVLQGYGFAHDPSNPHYEDAAKFLRPRIEKALQDYERAEEDDVCH